MQETHGEETPRLTWRQRYNVMRSVLGVCKRCMALSAVIAVLGILLVQNTLFSANPALILLSSVVLGFGGLLAILHVIFLAVNSTGKQGKKTAPSA